MKRILTCAVLVSACCTVFAQSHLDEPDYLKDAKPYVPKQNVSGTIRVWGNNYIPALMKQWEDGFSKYQPAVRFETRLPGTEAALAALYANTADLTFVGREAYPAEVNAFKGRFGYAPTEIQISSGSFATPHKTFALMVFVHKDNPLAHISMLQLARIFGCGCDNEGKPIRTWGQVGLTGKWADKPMHVYGYSFETGMAGYFQRVVLHDTHKWNDQLKEFDNGRDAKGEVINAGVYVLGALAKDPYGIAYANVLYANPDVKTLALGETDAGPFAEPTRTNAWLRKYPLTRYTTVFLNRAPGQPVDAKVKEFVRYILSREGIQAVVSDGAYLPLNSVVAGQQLRKLE